MLIFFLLTGLSFKTESRIQFLTPGTGGTKVLGNIPESIELKVEGCQEVLVFQELVYVNR